jgi:hypothetical protein
MYVRDNIVVGGEPATHQRVGELVVDDGMDMASAMVSVPFDVPEVTTHSAAEAYELVLQYGGALLPKRDAVDERVRSEVLSGTGQVIDSQKEVGGWPTLDTVPPPTDEDNDGMPDEWERTNGLDPADSSDGAELAPDGYTHIEHYLNELAAPAMQGTVAGGL